MTQLSAYVVEARELHESIGKALHCLTADDGTFTTEWLSEASDFLRRALELASIAASDAETTPIVVVTRDPDASNDYAVFDGEVETYDIDAGYSELGDEGEFLEWAESHLGAAKQLAATHPEAAEYIRNTVLSYAEWKGHQDVPAFITLAEQTEL